MDHTLVPSGLDTKEKWDATGRPYIADSPTRIMGALQHTPAPRITVGSWVRLVGSNHTAPVGEVIAVHGGYAWVAFPNTGTLAPVTHRLINIRKVR
jgi:hypothetical protein